MGIKVKTEMWRNQQSEEINLKSSECILAALEGNHLAIVAKAYLITK